MKTCPRCGSNGPFYKKPTAKDGLHSWCVSCHKADGHNRRIENKKRNSLSGILVCPNKQCSKCGSAGPFYKCAMSMDGFSSWCIKCDKEKGQRRYISVGRNINLKKLYGISEYEWNILFELQGRKCKICGITDPGKGGWQTDHNHKNKKVRGILCNKCNRGIGYFNDNPYILQLAADYLEINNDTRAEQNTCAA